jgi:hypothetical protein
VRERHSSFCAGKKKRTVRPRIGVAAGGAESADKPGTGESPDGSAPQSPGTDASPVSQECSLTLGRVHSAGNPGNSVAYGEFFTLLDATQFVVTQA